MKPFMTWTGAAVMALAALAMTAPSAAARGSHWHSHHRHHYHHHHRHNYGAALGFGLLSGVIVGDALAGPYGPYPYGPYGYRYVPRPAYRVYYPPRYYRYPPRYYRAHRLSRTHVRWCYAHYRSYRASDNTFQPYHGPRRACISPYG